MFASCTAWERLNSGLAKLNTIADKLEVKTEPIQRTFDTIEKGLSQLGEKGEKYVATVANLRSAFTVSDLNGDKKLSGIQEFMALIKNILIALGLTGGAGAAWLSKRNSDSGKLKAELSAKVANLERVVHSSNPVA
tara:strand:+ start:15344 stop:15751 length:408 start_codon:yes stop_codon:yes gene_type:complete